MRLLLCSVAMALAPAPQLDAVSFNFELELDECPLVPELAAFVLTGFSVGAAALFAALRKRS